MVKHREKKFTFTIDNNLVTEQPKHSWYVNYNKDSDFSIHLGINVNVNWVKDYRLYEFLHKIPDNKYYLPTDDDYKALKPSFNRLYLNIQPYAEIMKTKFSHDRITLLIKKNNHILDFKLIQLTSGFPYDEPHILDITRNKNNISKITIVSP